MARSSFDSLRSPFSSQAIVVVVGSVLAALTLSGCAGDGRRVVRSSPEAGPGASDRSHSRASEALPAGEPTAELPGGAPQPTIDPIEQIVARAQEEYDQGVESLRGGDSRQARERFEAALQIFMSSGLPLDSDDRLRRGYDKLVDDIASLEAEMEEAPAPPPDAVPSPAEELEDITTELSPEETRRGLEKVSPEVRRTTFDIPVVLNEKVLAFINLFQTRRDMREAFIGGYQRYGWYEEMIRRTFREEGMPEDLIYVAFLESTYKTSAYSRVRAKGIWQFMTPTGREYGLRINRYVDDRSSPEKATRAAARYLRDLYETFNDWHLAIAAYNTGAGNIMRAQRRSGKKDFWDLAKTRYLRTETRNFVPAILALAVMAQDPARYGFEGLQHNPTLEYDRVTVSGPTQISLVARLSGSSEDEIRFLNPHLRLGVTPPGEKEYEVLVPAGRGDQFASAYLELPEEERTARLAHVHTVRRGETLASIASRYGTSVSELRSANGIRNAHRLSVGMQLSVPSYPAGRVADDEVRPARTRRSRSAAVAGSGPYHVVRRGETLFSIARAYGIPLKSLLQWNGMTERSVIMPGTRLAVRRESAQAAETAGMISVPGGGEAAPDPAGEKVVYKVRRGDNLFRIARMFRTTVDNLKAWNRIPGDSIRAGDILTIYPN